LTPKLEMGFISDMKVAFVGKGGSGKTTLAALFVRSIAHAHSVHDNSTHPDSTHPDSTRPDSTAPLLAIDADINQHLAAALGDTDEERARPALGDHLPMIKEYLRGANPRISSAATMVKTTPPGSGSRLISLAERNPLYDRLVTDANGIRLAVTGPFSEDDLGVACYHSKVGAVELLLNHLVDGPGEYAVVDMTAGADSFASGLFTRFDRTFLVCEPTVRSVGVYRQYRNYARDHDVAVTVVGNKIEDADDVAFLREHIGADLLTWIGRSAFVKAAERGRVRPITELEPANRDALRLMREAVDATPRDPWRYTAQAVEFHLRNAKAWANDRVGEDLAEQIDPDFVLPISALASAK
jgi:CO dehydrogenase maturation factor